MRYRYTYAEGNDRVKKEGYLQDVYFHYVRFCEKIGETPLSFVTVQKRMLKTGIWCFGDHGLVSHTFERI